MDERDTPPRNYPAKLSQAAPHSPPEKYHKLAPPIFTRGRTGNLPPISAPRNPTPHSSPLTHPLQCSAQSSTVSTVHSAQHTHPLTLTHSPRSQPRPGQADCLPGAPAFQALTPHALTTNPPPSQAEKVPVYLRGNGKYYYRACLACPGKALC